MARPSHREKILAAGLEVVHRRGFAGASVRDIVQAAGVPQGSFTNHFASKEAFGLEVIDRYFADTRALMDATLGDETLRPLQRLEAYVDAGLERRCGDQIRSGCLLGNFAAESCEQGEAVRARLATIFTEIEAAIARCLDAAKAAGQLSADIDSDGAAGAILAGLQGATLLAKVEGGPAPIQRFKTLLFGTLLAPAG